ncbi:MAG: glycosyltransferase [Streptosporangiales bacterium]|nr:glycosyltransferase [Streptosporangiales bacterium]
MSTAPLRIAMIGQKGVPATFGGIERHVEEVGARLAVLGHEVHVYCRPNYASVEAGVYRGMRLHSLSTVNSKHLDAITHSMFATMAAMRQRPDIVHYHALGPGLVAPLPRLFSSARVVLTVHGLDQQRAKWGRSARTVLETAHWMSGRVPDATVVVSKALVRHYAERFDRRAVYVANGVNPPTPRPAEEIVKRYGLTPGSYVLFVGRLVPEKAPDLLIRAYRRVSGHHRLVVVGGSSFTDDYVTGLHELARADPRVILTGYVYGDLLAELYTNAAAFVLPSNVEGLPLTLLEAIGYGLPVIASDIDPHREICGRDGPGHRMFSAGDEDSLELALRLSLRTGERERVGADELRRHVVPEYRWEAAASRLEELYLNLTTRGWATGRQGIPTSDHQVG